MRGALTFIVQRKIHETSLNSFFWPIDKIQKCIIDCGNISSNKKDQWLIPIKRQWILDKLLQKFNDVL